MLTLIDNPARSIKNQMKTIIKILMWIMNRKNAFSAIYNNTNFLKSFIYFVQGLFSE